MPMDVSPAFQARLDSVLEQHASKHGTPGIALALTDRMGSLYTVFRGCANLDSGTPVTPDALFEIGSISKSFTAIAILQLCETGRLDLHASAADALPWFEVQSRFAPITLHHLLCHTAGIINGSDLSSDAAYEVWSLRHTQASCPPGARYHYSNVGYKALGLVLEAVYARPYGEILQEKILTPLGMHATHPSITHALRRRMAVGYDPLFDDRPYHPGQPLVPATWLEYGWGDGSIASTAADMAIYARMLLNRGQTPGGRLLTEKSFDLLIQRAAEPADEEHGTFYGYGLNVHETDGHACLSHSGGMVGYQAYLLVDMDEGLGVVALINGPGEVAEAARFALRLLQAERSTADLGAVARPPSAESKASSAEYVGEYRGARGSFRVDLDGDDLRMVFGGERVRLHPRGADRFYVEHPDFSRYLLTFTRENGQAVEALHGPDWYPSENYRGPFSFDAPSAWAAYCGHYRSHNPWLPNFRVVTRKGALLLILPSGEEQPLAPTGPQRFRVGADVGAPEWVEFDTFPAGQALRANLSGCGYFRTFTP